MNKIFQLPSASSTNQNFARRRPMFKTEKPTVHSALSHAECFLLVGLAASFIFQPLNIRVFGYSASVIIMTFIVILGAISRPHILTVQKIAISLVPIAILVIYDFIINGDVIAANLIIMLLFITLYYDQIVPQKYLKIIWSTAGFVCLALTLVGAYRFGFGYEAAKSENVSGFYEAVNQYVYFGISYLPSTRNSDALYFACGALIFLWRFSESPRFISWNMLGFFITACGVALSLSRGIWIAVLLAIALSYRPARLGKLLPAAIAIVFCASIIQSEFIFSLMKNALVSIFDDKAANIGVNGYYTFSNQIREEIYVRAIRDFLSFPLGHGVSYLPSYAPLTGAKRVHSENLYLDFMIVFGVFALPYFWKVISLIVQTRTIIGPYAKLVQSMALMIAIYLMFNGGMDFAFLWFILAMTFMTERSSRAYKTTKFG
jgi:hypothetical protein